MIGSAVVGDLDDGWLGSRLKLVSSVDMSAAPGSAPLELSASLVWLLAPLELADSVLTVFDAVGQSWL